MSQLCPCGSNAAYNGCCGRYHQGEPAPTAESLMRSRYSAYAVGDLNYIRHTASGKALAEAQVLEKPTEQTDIEWTQLKILAKEGGGMNDSHGTVTFSAYFRQGNQPLQVMHEKSQFEKIDGQWFYVDGEAASVPAQPKIPRNDPCPCGSGQKFKKCCGA